MAAHKKSITGRVTRSSYMLMTILTVPIILSMTIMVLNAARYHESVSRMETVAALKPMISDDISGELWSAISGMRSFDECGVYETLENVNSALDEQILLAEQNGQLQLTVARRTMDTLQSYVEQIGNNINSGAPVSDSEQLIEEVRNVAALAVSMLEEFITQEISSVAGFTQQLQNIVIAAAVIEAIILLAAVLLTRSMISRTGRNIKEPIGQLEHFASALADGNLHARIPSTDVEELETLTESYNTMADRLESLIAQNEQKQVALRKSELSLLQAQINPHFLYNTLDAIVWQAESGNSAEVVHLTSALSDFFRISLSSGADWIPVSQEMKHLTGYLSIQKTRYRDILTTRIDIQDDIGDIYMLKLLLQPLVENALYHGIKNKRGGGTITVVGRREEGYLFFSVSDTGAGMSPEKLNSVLAMLKETQDTAYRPERGSSGFGLPNVDQRIRLYYKQDEGLLIESGKEGTTISFRVPCRMKGEFEND